jgi:HlyD family secretion protein
MKKKYLIIILAVAAAAVIFIVLQESRGTPVETQTVKRGDIREFVEERGCTRLRREFVVTVPIMGTVGEVSVNEGDLVDEGTVIAKVEDVEINAAIEAAEAQVEEIEALAKGVDAAKPKKEAIAQAAAALAQAQETLKSHELQVLVFGNAAETAVQDLADAKSEHASGTIPDSRLRHVEDAALAAKARVEQQKILINAGALSVEIANAAYILLNNYADDNEFQREAYRARIKGIKSQLESLLDRKTKAVIRSPIKGKVYYRFSPGKAFLPAGYRLALIGDPESIEISVNILTDDAIKVKKGQTVVIELENGTIRGKVDRLQPTGEPRVSTLGVKQDRVDVIISFDNSKVKLPRGYGVDVKIITNKKKNKLLLPERAAFKKKGKQHVFRIRNGRAELVEISTGLSNDDFFEVTGGLEAGDEVILAPPAELEDGARVKGKLGVRSEE